MLKKNKLKLKYLITIILIYFLYVLLCKKSKVIEGHNEVQRTNGIINLHRVSSDCTSEMCTEETGCPTDTCTRERRGGRCRCIDHDNSLEKPEAWPNWIQWGQVSDLHRRETISQYEAWDSPCLDQHGTTLSTRCAAAILTTPKRTPRTRPRFNVNEARNNGICNGLFYRGTTNVRPRTGPESMDSRTECQRKWVSHYRSEESGNQEIIDVECTEDISQGGGGECSVGGNNCGEEEEWGSCQNSECFCPNRSGRYCERPREEPQLEWMCMPNEIFVAAERIGRYALDNPGKDIYDFRDPSSWNTMRRYGFAPDQWKELAYGFSKYFDWVSYYNRYLK